MTDFAIRKVLDTPYEQVLARVPEALKAEGFGVLTEIDVKETLKKKLDVDFRRYKILGACNPSYAHKALSAVLEIGVMLPCNVVVFERDDRKTMVLAVDPMQTVAAAEPSLREIATEIRLRLERAVKSLS
jgi:uncharacterized protein (DUF302 family)